MNEPRFFQHDPQLETKLNARIGDRADCWLWTGTKTVAGYGRLFVAGREYYAHRLAYETWVGPIPDGLTIDHLCRVKACVNPAHLEPVTLAENIRRAAVTTHCRRGHPFDEANTRLRPNGSRACRTCVRLSDRAYCAANRRRIREIDRETYYRHHEARLAKAKSRYEANRAASR